MILNQGLDGSSLIVQGDGAANDIHVYFNNGIWTVSDNGPIVCRRRLPVRQPRAA